MRIQTPPSGENDVLPQDEQRAKYSDQDREQLAKQGVAMPDGSYPVADSEDLDNAIQAVGRGGADHDAIRRHIIARAKDLGLSERIPDNWNPDGSLKQVNGALRAAAERRRKERRRVVPLIPEVRQWSATGLEVREQSNTNELVIAGTPIVYDTPYVVADKYGEFEERMSPGVADKVLERGADVRFLFNHDGLPLARSTSGTMTLTNTPDALVFEARLDARQQLANDLAVAIERGDVSQMSCGFIVARDEWDSEYEHRTVHEFADLLDVSAVTYPASPTTSIAIARRMSADLRAGKVLSQSNQDKLVEAAKSIHAVLGAAGVDLSASEPDADDEQRDEPDVTGDALSTADGTFGGNLAGDGSPGYQDGTGTRAAEPVIDPGEPVAITRKSSRLLTLQLQARSYGRKAA